MLFRSDIGAPIRELADYTHKEALKARAMQLGKWALTAGVPTAVGLATEAVATAPLEAEISGLEADLAAEQGRSLNAYSTSSSAYAPLEYSRAIPGSASNTAASNVGGPFLPTECDPTVDPYCTGE